MNADKFHATKKNIKYLIDFSITAVCLEELKGILEN